MVTYFRNFAAIYIHLQDSCIDDNGRLFGATEKLLGTEGDAFLRYRGIGANELLQTAAFAVDPLACQATAWANLGTREMLVDTRRLGPAPSLDKGASYVLRLGFSF